MDPLMKEIAVLGVKATARFAIPAVIKKAPVSRRTKKKLLKLNKKASKKINKYF